jgi:CRP-like cAMP-binding protein
MWCYCESDVEYVSLPLSDFNSFWKAQFTLDLDRKYAFLKNVQLFRDLSEVSLLRLCEMMELKSYPRNTILFNDCSYRARPSTKVGRGFGLHPKGADDWNGIKFKTTGEVMTLKISSSKLYYLMQKHRSRIHTMKFKHLRYPGLFVLVDGTIEIEDDCGFRTTNFIGKGDYFGENLAFESEGFQRYGRMVVQSETAELYFLSLKNISRLILL